MELAISAVMSGSLKVLVAFCPGCFGGRRAFFCLFFWEEEASYCFIIGAVLKKGCLETGSWFVSVCIVFCIFAWGGMSTVNFSALGQSFVINRFLPDDLPRLEVGCRTN
jgi:hypothetical protein